MDHLTLHPWNVSPGEAVALQRKLRDQVRLKLKAPGKRFRRVAGADVSFNRFSNHIHAALVVLDLSSLQVVARAQAEFDTEFPYIPGLLSFREIPALLRAWESLEVEPDVVMLDGQGIAHPRRLGIASHFGLWIDRPTVGCAKSLLTGTYEPLGESRGSFSALCSGDELLGYALRSKDRSLPLFISPGHCMDAERSLELVEQCLCGYRIPEPTRQAHLYANELRRSAGPEKLKRAA